MKTGSDPKLSVVILNWNRSIDTILAAHSVLKQDYTNLEVLIWDNASSDNSRVDLTLAFDADPRVRLIWSDQNFGVAGGRNRAFREATGDLFFSLDSDAVMTTSGSLQHVAERMSTDPTIGAISFEVVRPDGHLMWPFSRPSSTWRYSSFDTIRIDGCSFATRKNLFEQIGGFAEHFSPYGAEDQYYALQVIQAGFRVVYDPIVSIVHAFNPAGRHGHQWAMHVRNMLWIPLELFPFPLSVTRFLTQAIRLIAEAFEQNTVRYFFNGLITALFGYRPKRRRPLNRNAWRYVKTCIRQDKRAMSTTP